MIKIAICYIIYMMDILSIIEKKKNKKVLTKKEIQFFVDGVCSGLIKDFQTTSLLMAICLNGLNFDETYNLTMSMAHSGKVLDLTCVGNCVDKHSTGGVSDTTTLIVVPVLASLGVKVAKMSGRSLGFTGGTADKMEVFDGYQTEISTQKFVELVQQNNASIITQSADFALADKIIYNLRSQSGTVDNIGLIASSIMSKKIACGAKTLVLDCKYGSGAFMKTKSACRQLAKTMVKIGKRAGIDVCAVISSMEQPLSQYVGNNLEVFSALEVLSGKQNKLFEVSSEICALALLKQNKCKTLQEAKQLVAEQIKSGKAKQKLKQIVVAQGGKVDVVENPNLLIKHSNQAQVFATKSGFVSKILTDQIGAICHLLQQTNGQFERQDDVGIILNAQLGDKIKCGDKLATIHFNKADDIEGFKNQLSNCFVVGKEPQKAKLIDCIIE